MEENALLPDEAIAARIHWIRGEKVMLAHDLAKLYGVPTKRLNEAVKRNMTRFPGDFMFQLAMEEWANLRSQSATSSSWGGLRVPPYAFTEHGVLMLSSVLNSDRAIAVNIRIVRVFVRLSRLLQIALAMPWAALPRAVGPWNCSIPPWLVHNRVQAWPAGSSSW